MTGVGRVGGGGNVHCQEFTTRILCLSYIKGISSYCRSLGAPLFYGCRLPVMFWKGGKEDGRVLQSQEERNIKQLTKRSEQDHHHLWVERGEETQG